MEVGVGVEVSVEVGVGYVLGMCSVCASSGRCVMDANQGPIQGLIL